MSQPFLREGAVDLHTKGEGFKYDAGKPRLSLVPFDALIWVARVMEFGLRKYKQRDSWRQVENGAERYADAGLRHRAAMLGGEFLDPESGLPHIAHYACNALFECAISLRDVPYSPREEKLEVQ